MVCPICGTCIIDELDTGSRCINFIVTSLPIKNYHHFSLHSRQAFIVDELEININFCCKRLTISNIDQKPTEYNHFTIDHKYDVQTIARIH
ncbi:MAG: hypothetical protein PHW27_12555 [Melioribacteraceae bacterium]|nr:hypothetical protein [Melioribacteraceae bacterium]MDD3559390.1 hypothetical protein [Melioribacteraceae bacterium]